MVLPIASLPLEEGELSYIEQDISFAEQTQFISLYNPLLPKNYILYLDVTNLYGHSMVQDLPVDDFKFLNDKEIEKYMNNINELFVGGKRGFILEVDLDYPISLHDKHIDLPFAPEHLDGKLSPNFYDKKNYKIHYKHLELCLKHV